MPYFITIQYPYQYLTITISEQTAIVATESISKIQAVGLLLPTLQNMLAAQNLTLSEIACIGINTGPGPFNTLRSIVATANGISFAKKIPLVGCNGLQLMLQENHHPDTVAILDAFGMDVYYAMKAPAQQGYTSIANLMAILRELTKKEVKFIGNGALKYKEFITQHFTGAAEFDDEFLFASTQSLVDETVQKFNAGLTSTEIFPLYFESPVIKS